MNREKLRQKVLLGLLGVVALGVSLGGVVMPLLDEAERLQTSIATSRDKSAKATLELKKQAREEQQRTAEAARDAWAERTLAAVPNPYIVAGHRTITQTLRAHGVENPKTHVSHVLPFRQLPEYAVAAWEVQAPTLPAPAVGQLVADLENVFPLGHLSELTLKTVDTRGTVQAGLIFNTVVTP